MPTKTMTKTNGHTEIEVPDSVGKLAQEMAERVTVLEAEIEKLDAEREQMVDEQAKLTAALLAMRI